MEEQKKKSTTIENDKEIVFSKAIKAGKRIYYLDVKKNRKDEMFIAITESKKVVSLDKDDPQVNFEKHKIFLFHSESLTEASSTEDTPQQSGEIKIDIDF